MAAINHLTSLASSTNTTSYTTPSFTPTAGALVVALVFVSGSVLAGATLSDSLGGSFAKKTNANGGMSGDMAYIFAGAAGATASSQTITFDCTGDAATGCIIEVFEITGMSRFGTDAVRQSKFTTSQANDSITLAFDASCLTGNPTIAVGINQGGSYTTVTGWTLKNNTGYVTPTRNLYYYGRDSGFTGTSVTINASSSNDGIAFLAEFDTSAAPSAGGARNQAMIII